MGGGLGAKRLDFRWRKREVESMCVYVCMYVCAAPGLCWGGEGKGREDEGRQGRRWRRKESIG